jgi:hypothetical protein
MAIVGRGFTLSQEPLILFQPGLQLDPSKNVCGPGKRVLLVKADFEVFVLRRVPMEQGIAHHLH